MRTIILTIILTIIICAACGTETLSPAPDAARPVDAGLPDAAPLDAAITCERPECASPPDCEIPCPGPCCMPLPDGGAHDAR